ncbi:RICIN domain-containing protein [Luteolibacter sp.]|uniref:RICIN domain-containing protein n=1 Tax=Luteolibacter sp. TaxID=1962973 RepID=UPI0032661BD8
MTKNPIASLRTLVAIVCPLAGISPASAYTHPSVPLTLDDLTTLKANLNTEPWKSGYAALAGDSHSSLGYGMQGPFANVSRNPNVNLNQWRNDMTAVYNLARMWYFTGNPQYAQKSHDILLAWANTQTSFTGMEANLDLGDYAFRFTGGADILRGTWSGWTQTDTDAVKNLFGNVYWTLGGNTLGPTNKGALSLAAGTAIAAFCDDQVKMDKALYLYRTFASTGLRNTLSNGEHGETARDSGHAYNHISALAFSAEIFWKQGIDVYSELDQRLLAMGEYYCRYVLGAPTSFVPMGTTDEYYMGPWDLPGYTAEPRPFDILKSHYELRKGLPAPWINRKLASQPGNMDAFMFLKSADSSTATPPAPIAFPSQSLVSTGMTSTDIGGASPAGSSSYTNGIWTVNGAGTDIWTHGSEAFHYVYKQVTGDCTLIAKVDSLQNLGTNNKAGVMIRSDLNATPTAKAWVALKPDSVVESYFHGWAEMYGGSNWEKQGYPITQPSWWVKIERLGNIVTTYASPDGTSWATLVIGRYDNLGTSPYLGLCVTSNKPGTLCTATFSNVSITTGNGAAPVAAPSAPLSVLAAPGENRVPLRWSESFGATSYKVKRATTSGGPHTTIATVTAPSYVDATASNGTTYYYVVSAVNAVGEGTNSAQDYATPVSPMVNVAFAGTATSSDNPTGTPGSQAPASAFDTLPGSKWFDGIGTTGWLQYDFGSGNAQTIKRYTVTSANDLPDRDPKNWQFLGSNDGSAWTTLDTQSNQTFAYRFQLNTYPIASSGSYRYYRLNITANNGNTTSLQLAELGLFTDTGRTIPNGTYRVSSRKSRKALDLQNGAVANGTALVQWGWNGGNSQKWTLTHLGNGQYQIANSLSGTVMEVDNANMNNNGKIQIWTANGLNHQKWTATPAGDGFFKLTAVHSGKLADVNGGSTADGATIIQWQSNGGDNQQWSFSTAP